MAYKTMYFSRSSSGYNAEDGDYIDYTPDSSISFGSNAKATYFYFDVDGGLTSATSSARTHGANLQVKSNGTWYEIWDGDLYLPKKGTTGYDISFSGSIPSSYQSTIGTYGISDLRLQQQDSSAGNNFALRGTSGEGTLEIKYEVVQPSLGNPGTPSITQNNNGTYRITWSAPSYSNGSGSPTYTVKYGSTTVVSSSTSRDHTLTIPSYGSSLTFTVTASYSGLTSSSSKSITFVKPAVKAPSNLKVKNSTSHTGATAPLAWTAGSFSSYLTGSLAYEIYKGDTLVTTTSAGATSYTIPESKTKGWGTSAVTLKIRGKGTGLSNTSQGSTLYSGYTSTVSYTYKATVSTQPSNLKINGGTSYTGATAPLTWSAAAFSGSQTPTYSIRVDGTQIDTTTSTSYTIPESTTKSYTTAKTITIVATGGGATSNATNGVTYTYSPTIKAPSGLKINSATSYTGRTAPLTWTAGSLSNGAAVTYSLRKGGTEFATTTATSYTVSEDVTKGWGTSAVKLTVVATGSGKTSEASNEVTYTYQPAFTANPTNLKINNGSSYTGQTAPLTWTAATISNGATITYTIYNGSTNIATTTSTSYTIPETTTKGWSGTVTLKIVATASGITSSATATVSYTYSPALSAPTNLKIAGDSSFVGQTAQLTWNAASLSNGAIVTYSIRKNGTEFATTTETSYTIPESTAINWGTSPVTITVFATGSGKVSDASNEVSFTYKSAYKTVKYNTGNGWVECIAYYHDGTRWVKCDTYYHTGSGWQLSDH